MPGPPVHLILVDGPLLICKLKVPTWPLGNTGDVCKREAVRQIPMSHGAHDVGRGQVITLNTL